MLVAMRCDCGGSENLIRRALEKGGLPNWLNFPIAVGKNAAISTVQSSSLPQDHIEIRSLLRFLHDASSFAVVLGYKNGVIRWVNLSDHSTTSRLDAEVIIEKLA